MLVVQAHCLHHPCQDERQQHAVVRTNKINGQPVYSFKGRLKFRPTTNKSIVQDMVIRRFYWCLILLPVWAAAPMARAAEDSAAYLQQIRTEALAFLQDELSQQSPRDQLEIRVSNPEPRIKLARCDKPLTYALHGNATNASNVTVKVSCEANASWSFYLTASVDHWREVAVASRSIRRGDMLTGADIQRDRRRLSGTGLSAVDAPESVIGMVARRPIRAGDIIRSSQLAAPLAIKRGDTVKIKASNTSIAIVTSGEALSNGSVGQQIRIRNLNSERVIRARVTGPGEAEVVL